MGGLHGGEEHGLDCLFLLRVIYVTLGKLFNCSVLKISQPKSRDADSILLPGVGSSED